MRSSPTGPILSGVLVVALALDPGGAAPAAAALPGRLDAADLMRLTAVGHGVVDAAGPALDAAVGRAAATFAKPGCEPDGRTYRPVAAPHATLQVDVPAKTRRLDIAIRPVHGPRELSVHLDEHVLGTVPLAAGWQRASFPVDPKAKLGGPRALRLELANTAATIDEGPGMPAGLRALLGSIRFSERPEAPPIDADAPRPGASGERAPSPALVLRSKARRRGR